MAYLNAERHDDANNSDTSSDQEIHAISDFESEEGTAKLDMGNEPVPHHLKSPEKTTREPETNDLNLGAPRHIFHAEKPPHNRQKINRKNDRALHKMIRNSRRSNDSTDNSTSVNLTEPYLILAKRKGTIRRLNRVSRVKHNIFHVPLDLVQLKEKSPAEPQRKKLHGALMDTGAQR